MKCPKCNYEHKHATTHCFCGYEFTDEERTQASINTSTATTHTTEQYTHTTNALRKNNRCPLCNLENAPTALRCDCGYEFATGQMKQSYVHTMRKVPYVIASTGKRFLNLIIDIVLYYIIVFLCSFAAIVVLSVFNLVPDRDSASFSMLSYCISFCVYYLYYFIFEILSMQTPGKMITKTKVVMEDGTEPSVATIAKRTIIRFVPFDGLSILFTGGDARCWHDRWSHTIVINK